MTFKLIFKLIKFLPKNIFRDFPKLAKVQGKLQEAFNRISQLHGKRVFATYFRIGFYGSKLGDLNRKEYIYKERPLTKLPEIFSRLQMFSLKTRIWLTLRLSILRRFTFKSRPLNRTLKLLRCFNVRRISREILT